MYWITRHCRCSVSLRCAVFKMVKARQWPRRTPMMAREPSFRALCGRGSPDEAVMVVIQTILAM
jgi:hypothetical protein